LRIPFYLKSTFGTNLRIKFVEFSNYGHAFSFDWISDLSESYGIVRAESTSLLGFIQFDSRVLCNDDCYLGLSPRTHHSIIDQTSLFIENFDNLESYEVSILYDLWTRSFQLRQLNILSNENSDAFDIDSKLLMLYYKRWSLMMELKEKNDLFKSLLRLEMENENNADILSLSFPINFNFEWPCLLKNTQKIHFSSTQVHVGTRVKNLTVINPSNMKVLMQIMILDAYPQSENLIKLFKNISAHYGLKNSPIQYDTLNEDDLNDVGDNVFTLTSSASSTISTSNKNVIVISLEPNQSADIQIQFKPEKMKIYHSLLLIRNNLTIMDTYFIKAKGGSANVRIENMAPMKSSLFLNDINQNFVSQKSSDYSPLEFQMSDNDFKLCGDSTGSYFKKFNPFSGSNSGFNEEEKSKKKKEFVLAKTNNGETIYLPIDFLNATIEPNNYDLQNKDYVTAYEVNDGIVLREIFELKNIGDAKLFVYSI
jgi:hypothetical protein